VERSRLDRKLAVVGLLCGSSALFVAVRIGKGIGISLTVFLSCLAYLIIERLTHDGVASVRDSDLDYRKLLALLIANTLFLISFLTYSVHSLSYQRPLEYFIAASVSGAIIGIELYMFPRRPSRLLVLGALLQILLLSASIRFGVLFQYPGIIGSDSYHSILTDYIVRTGHVIPSNYVPSWQPEYGASVSSYSSFPLMHIVVAIFSLLTSISSYKESIILTVGIFEIVSLLFFFALCRTIISDLRQVLFATLVLALSARLIFWGIWIIPQSFGLALFIMVLYLLVSSRSRNQYSKLLLLLLTLLCITLAHTVSSFLTVLIILIFLASGSFLSRIASSEYALRRGRVTIYLSLFSMLLVIVCWAFFSNFLTQEVNSLVYNFNEGLHVLALAPAGKNYSSYEIDNIGSYLFYALGIIGGLTWLRDRVSVVKFEMLVAATGLLLFIYSFWLTSLSAFLPDRWFAFGFVLAAPAASEGLKRLLAINRRRYAALALVFILLFSFTFLMTMNSDIDIDNPLIGTGQVVRYSYLSSEMIGANWAKDFSKPPFYADQGFIDYFFSELRTSMTYIDFSTPNSYVAPSKGTLIIRNYIYERPVPEKPYGALTIVGSSFQIRIENLNRIYSNAEVTLYVPDC
jgi:hypothetical protein